MEAARATGARPGKNWADHYIEVVRDEIRADKRVLSETRDGRRALVLRACKSFAGYLNAFASGSLAHGTVNKPVSDADVGVVLDRRVHLHFGPDRLDAPGLGPRKLMEALAEHIKRVLATEYPNVRYKLSKRAITFYFFEPLSEEEDPTVDVVICLTRRDAPGYWIPNTEKPRGWDASDPETHTRMMTKDGPRAVRIFRAQVVRLVKAAVNNDKLDDVDHRVMCPWNISALALYLIRETGENLTQALANLFFDMAAHIAAHRETADPAGVADPIRLPLGAHSAIRRLRFFGGQVQEAIDHADDHEAALTALGRVFRKELPNASTSPNDQVAGDLRRGRNHGLYVTGLLGAGSRKSERSDGDG